MNIWRRRAAVLRRCAYSAFDADMAEELREMAAAFDKMAQEEERFGGPKGNWRSGAPTSEEKPSTPGADLPAPTPDKPDK